MALVEPALALKELVSEKSCLEEYCRYCSTRLVLDAKDGIGSLFSLYFLALGPLLAPSWAAVGPCRR